MKVLLRKVILNCTILMLLLAFSVTLLYADTSTGWKDFSLVAQEGISDGTFAVEELRFVVVGDVEAEVKIKNNGREEARVAVSIGLFDSDKLLLTAVSFSSVLLQPNNTDQVAIEFLGSAEVLPQIRYYQLSIIERGEK